MRVALTAVLALLLVTAAPATGGEVTEREDAQSYVSNGFFVGGHGNLIGQDHHMALPEDTPPVVFDPRPGDRFVRLEIEDATGRPAAVLVQQEVPGAHHPVELEFCADAQFIALRAATPLEVRIFSGVCHNHRYGVATTGTITATFSR